MAQSSRKDGRSSWIAAGILLRLYRRISSETVRRRLRTWILALEGGPALSLSIRTILERHHGVVVGLHSIAPCMMVPGVIRSGTSIGRYSTLADTVRTFTRDHPMNTKSSHAVFYNPGLGMATTHLYEPHRLEIGHGVSIGDNAIIQSATKSIGVGAAIAPGAVVYRDVPPYAIVQGNPAQVIGFRYPKNVIEELLASRWWEKTAAGEGMPAEHAAFEASNCQTAS
jgi:virginiamycin A acetyltransferase